MSTCKWDREKADYLRDGEPCRHDEYGDPTRHCTAKRSCSHHVGPRELTCGRCLGDVRNDIRQVVELAALMPVEALVVGVQSEAANLAGPHVDVRSWSERRVAMHGHLLAWEAQGRITEKQYVKARTLMEDDDDLDPEVLLNRWHMMIAEDYGHELPSRMTLGTAAKYLGDKLGKIAQDDGQDFALLKREVETCRKHLESVLHNSQAAERGAPCPDCGDDGEGKKYVRLVREFAHWCLDPECCQEHYATDQADRWVCPRDKKHWWSETAYRSWVEERRLA